MSDDSAAFNPMPSELQPDYVQGSSAAPDPSASYAASPDQDPSMNPVGQSMPMTSPANYPASPDEGGPSLAPIPPNPAGGTTHKILSAVLSTLSGVADHLVGAGRGLETGGIPGAVAGAVDPATAKQVFANRMAISNAKAQAAQATAQGAMQDVQFARDNHDVQMAQAQLNLHALEQHDAGQLSGADQSALLKDAAQAGQQLQDRGITPVFTGSEEDAEAHRNARMQVADGNPVGVVKLPNADGTFSVYEVPNNDLKYNKPVDLTIGFNDGPKGDGSPITKTYGAGTVSVAQALAMESAAWVDHVKFQRQESLQSQKTEGQVKVQGVKNQGALDKQALANQAKAAKVDTTMYVGSADDGSQIAGTAQQLQDAGAQGVTKLPTDESKKVIVARQLIAPNGLFAQVNSTMRQLDAQGQLGVVASRWNDFEANKIGDNPLFHQLSTAMGLLDTALMQAHVGSRGSEGMMEHFKNLANEGKLNGPTLRAALKTEFNYVGEKAMLPKPKKAGAQ